MIYTRDLKFFIFKKILFETTQFIFLEEEAAFELYFGIVLKHVINKNAEGNDVAIFNMFCNNKNNCPKVLLSDIAKADNCQKNNSLRFTGFV